MCILVGKRNAAVNDFDVAIPNRFKIENYTDTETVVAVIRNVLSHYDDLIGEFSSFREKIARLEENFIRQIEQNFAIETDRQ